MIKFTFISMNKAPIYVLRLDVAHIAVLHKQVGS
jgi:hypothetical protein